MSGHSKWSTIKRQKAIDDAKKGAVYTKIAKKIQLAAKKGGIGDLDKNPYLRQAVDDARSVNMPMENIKRAIDKALGTGDESNVEEVVYEAYGLGGVGFLVTCATDNRNRTGGEIKTIFDRAGGSLGSPGSVSYLKSIQPIPMIRLDGDDLAQCLNLIDSLEENEDVVDVWSNLDSDE